MQEEEEEIHMDEHDCAARCQPVNTEQDDNTHIGCCDGTFHSTYDVTIGMFLFFSLKSKKLKKKQKNKRVQLFKKKFKNPERENLKR